jgi:ABC transport system ATP-binding/permease protein
MSEEILRALTQLFAIVTKQDGGVSENERAYVLRFFQQELPLNAINEYISLYDEYSDYNKQNPAEVGIPKVPSVKDSLRTLGICRKINKTLTQKQKVIVLLKLLELAGSDKHFSPQRMEIINTVATVFNISPEEYKLLETFITAEEISSLNNPNLLVANIQSSSHSENLRHEHLHLEGHLVFLRVQSVDIYFVKYLGDQSNMLNGFLMQPNRVYLFSHGASIKTQPGDSIYYSDLVANFNHEIRTSKLSFKAHIGEYHFPNGAIGLRNIHIAEGPGKLIGIMGASGAGKTTLLNVLAGLEKSDTVDITINGFNIHKQKEKIHGAIGYVPQDDLLMEDLTVYENLYYNAKLCFANYPAEQLHQRTHEMLENLGLEQRKDLRVGNTLNKTISGGQRKRLNIALELIREPAVLFLDEPTSGLSSRDSENVIDLLKELSLKGKLVVVVIHQPSSDIFKMFDKIIIMDTGGYPVYYGNPVEAVTYFKRATNQVDSNRGQCEICGNVNPEQIFNIIEAHVVDEYGLPTAQRKVTPGQWHEKFVSTFKQPQTDDIKEETTWALHIPNKLQQMFIFAKRDFLSKISNKQYLLINLLEAPLLAAILTLIIRYRNIHDSDEYLFRFNDNIPAYLLMSIIVALFMGLTVSAEEIIRDRKILKRESFLNLSWNSYLTSKLVLLFTLSAVQTLLFVLIGHFILDIEGMHLAFWVVLFSTSCFANVLGLNISSAFNSAVTVYILIPLLLVPQMILSGTMFSFEKLNENISTTGKVPVLADLMASRWAYEAMAVYQFQYNAYQREFFQYEKAKSVADFKVAFISNELEERVQQCADLISSNATNNNETYTENLAIIYNTLRNEEFKNGIENLDLKSVLSPANFTLPLATQLQDYLKSYRSHYQNIFNENVAIFDKKMLYLEQKGIAVNEYKNDYYNENLSELVRNVNAIDRVVAYDGKLIQLIDPIYQDIKPAHIFDYRTPFFASEKNLAGMSISTMQFNLFVIWMMSLLLYIALYFEALKKFIRYMGRFTLRKDNK